MKQPLIGIGIACLIAHQAYAGDTQHQTMNHYADVTKVATQYMTLRATDNPQLESVVEPVWTGRAVRDGKIVQFKLDEADNYPVTNDINLTSTDLFFDDFAITRFDDWNAPAAYWLTLFKTSNGWRVATEAAISNACVSRAGQYDRNIAVQEVLMALGEYYHSVDTDSSSGLADIHHPTWEMKNHEGDAIAAEDPVTFAKRLEPNKHTGYANDRQIADIQIVYDCAAMVRIDKPSSKGVTVFTLYREGDDWMIVDKAWSNQK